MTTTIQVALAAELKAIKARVEKAANDAERRLLASQYGQRLAHLADRLKGVDLTDPTPQTSADAAG